MNPGYFSLILICIAVILLASGWKEVFLSKVPHKEILLFFVFWMLGEQVSVSFARFSVNGTFLVAAMLGVCIAFRSGDALRGTHMIVTGLLLSSVNVLLMEFFTIDPLFVITRPEIDTALWLSLLCLLMRRKPLEQIASLSIALVIGDALFQSFHRESLPIFLGSPAFQDKWWLSIVSVRLSSSAAQYAYSGIRKAAERLRIPKRGGWR